MKRDAQGIRDGTVLDSDICIVGGGPAGITLARELLGWEPYTSVLEGVKRVYGYYASRH